MPALIPGSTGSYPLRGVVAAAMPTLLGVEVFEASSVIPVGGNPGSIIVAHQVIRSQVTGFLHFAYSLTVTEADWDMPVSFQLLFDVHSAPVSFADFRVDSMGYTPPNSVEVKGNAFTFRFNFGLGVHKPSYTFFVSTAAREFRDSGAHITLTAGPSMSFEGPAPIAMPMRPVRVQAETATGGAENIIFETSEAARPTS